MLRFNSDNIHDLQEEFNLRSTEISLHIVESICYALDNNIDQITIGEFESEDIYNLGMELHCNSEDYLEALKTNLSKCIDAEEYDMCAKARDWIFKLESS